MQRGMAFIFVAHMLMTYWNFSFLAATYLLNRVPSNVFSGMSSFEILYLKPPNYGYLRTFVYQYFSCMTSFNQHKHQPRSL